VKYNKIKMENKTDSVNDNIIIKGLTENVITRILTHDGKNKSKWKRMLLSKARKTLKNCNVVVGKYSFHEPIKR